MQNTNPGQHPVKRQHNPVYTPHRQKLPGQ